MDNPIIIEGINLIRKLARQIEFMTIRDNIDDIIMGYIVCNLSINQIYRQCDKISELIKAKHEIYLKIFNIIKGSQDTIELTAILLNSKLVFNKNETIRSSNKDFKNIIYHLIDHKNRVIIDMEPYYKTQHYNRIRQNNDTYKNQQYLTIRELFAYINKYRYILISNDHYSNKGFNLKQTLGNNYIEIDTILKTYKKAMFKRSIPYWCRFNRFYNNERNVEKVTHLRDYITHYKIAERTKKEQLLFDKTREYIKNIIDENKDFTVKDKIYDSEEEESEDDEIYD